ncbi:hypothetical protein BS47DRAFT_1368149 [Hydnum rufescens UP504]|uniref:Uncharacterized protein n=1 Tax=Hydnum rufescens UP504 TaxID=1448309 RepID=A0A9P6DNL7_9AGAM|nr:hypothetical protein BS47DRAFT_1368149 [Hydnum rufescens UP504]
MDHEIGSESRPLPHASSVLPPYEELPNTLISPSRNPQITLLHQLLVNLLRQLPEASEYDFAFGQPFEDDLDDNDVQAFYHDSLTNIFGTHASIWNTMQERRLEVFKICSAPPTKGQLSPIQIALEMDGSVLWGHGKHAVTIADDFERVFTSVPGDGPMLQWVENLISMAQTSYTLFNKEYGVNRCLFAVNKGNEIIKSDLDPDTEDMFDPMNVSEDKIDEDHFLELNKPSPPVKRKKKSPTAPNSAVIGNHCDGTGDTTGENNNRGLQSQRPLKTKHQVIKSKLFIDDDHYDGDDGINASGIDSGGIDNGGIDSRGIGNSGINNGGIADGGIADGGIADSGIADDRIDNGGIANSGINDGRINDGGIDDSGIDDNGSNNGGIDTGQDNSGEINGSVANMLFKDKRAPSAWTGFQKTFKDTNKKPCDQSLQVWTCNVVALAYNAHRALLDNEGLKKFEDDMIQHCMDDEASKDLTKVLNGGCAKVMDCIGNQLSCQNSFFGMPAVMKAFQDMHQDMALLKHTKVVIQTWICGLKRHVINCAGPTLPYVTKEKKYSSTSYTLFSQMVLCCSSIFLWVWGKCALNVVFGWLDGLCSSNSPTGVVV